MNKLLLVMAYLLVLGGCAIPVRPIATMVPDNKGNLHFIPDKAQEPQINTGAIAGVLGMLGPYGQLAGAVLAAGGVAAAGHAHGKRTAKKAHNKEAPKPA